MMQTRQSALRILPAVAARLHNSGPEGENADVVRQVPAGGDLRPHRGALASKNKNIVAVAASGNAYKGWGILHNGPLIA